jgi:hypothetical protein
MDSLLSLKVFRSFIEVLATWFPTFLDAEHRINRTWVVAASTAA